MVYKQLGTLSLSSYPSKYLVRTGIGSGHSSTVFISPVKVSHHNTCVNHLATDVTKTTVKSIGNIGQPSAHLTPLKISAPNKKQKKVHLPAPHIPINVTPSEYKKLLQPAPQTLPKEPLASQKKRGIKRKSFNIIPGNG